MRKQLTDRSSIPGVVAELTLEEKLNLAGAYEACHTLAIPDMDILSLCLADGVTGVNGAQVVLDYTTSPKRNTDPELLQRIPYAGPEVVALCGGDLEETKEKYHQEKSRRDALMNLTERADRAYSWLSARRQRVHKLSVRREHRRGL